MKLKPRFGSRSARRVVLIVGDSLSAEYGLARKHGWVKLLADAWPKKRGEIRNRRRQQMQRQRYLSIASSTPASAARQRAAAARVCRRCCVNINRLVVVIELGANDGLRGLSLAALRENLRAMVRASRGARARVLLIAFQIPPNYGRDYAQGLVAIYAELAREEAVALVPFLLAGFADQLDLFQADRVHPKRRRSRKYWPMSGRICGRCLLRKPQRQP